MASKGKPRRDIDTAAYKKARIQFLEHSPVCHWCKRAAATTIDHVIEVDRGVDPMDQTNWVPACHKCNARRGAEYLAKKRAGQIKNRTVNTGISQVEPRPCEQCGYTFRPDWRAIERGRGKYCSVKCWQNACADRRIDIIKRFNCSVCGQAVEQEKSITETQLHKEQEPTRQTCGSAQCQELYNAAQARDRYRQQNPGVKQRNSKHPELRETKAEIEIIEKKQKSFLDTQTPMPPTPSPDLSPRGVDLPGDDGSSLNLPKAEAPGMIPPRLMSGLPSSSTYGPQVAKWAADHLSVELMPWQKLALDGQLTHDDEGNLTFRRSLISVARQNGKTVALTALIGWALTVEPVRRGQPVLVISTAHQLDLAVEIFERLAPILETKFGAKPYWSYGRNECVMPDGSRWLVQAATDRAFHGFSPTYIVADEIWNISPNVLFNGALPSQRAQQSPLMSCWSTAGTEDSKAMLRIREEALRAIDEHKITKLFMAEWSCPPGIDALANPGVWHMANPAIGYTLDPEVLVDEAEQSDKAAFMRASLNLWISASQAWLPPGLFAQLTVPDLPAGGVLAVDSSIDESLFCGVRAQLLADGRIGVTVEFVADTIQACWDRVTESAKTCQTIALTPSLHDMAPTALDRKKTCVGYSELLTHTGTIRQFIQEHRLVHTGEQMLAEHVDRAVGVKTSGGYVLSSQKSPGPITLARCMIFAAALIARPQQKSRAAIAFGPR